MKKIKHQVFPEGCIYHYEFMFGKALLEGADMLELDVGMTKDKKIILAHENYSKVLYKDLNNNKYPLLRDILRKYGKKTCLNIEIKNPSNINKDIEKPIARMLKDLRLVNDVIISSFNHHTLLRMKKLLPNVKLGMLFNCNYLFFEEGIEKLQPYSIHPESDLAFIPEVKKAHKLGYKVFTWTVKSKDEIKQLIKCKHIDGIIVDDLELF